MLAHSLFSRPIAGHPRSNPHSEVERPGNPVRKVRRWCLGRKGRSGRSGWFAEARKPGRQLGLGSPWQLSGATLVNVFKINYFFSCVTLISTEVTRDDRATHHSTALRSITSVRCKLYPTGSVPTTLGTFPFASGSDIDPLFARYSFGRAVTTLPSRPPGERTNVLRVFAQVPRSFLLLFQSSGLPGTPQILPVPFVVTINSNKSLHAP